MTSSLVGKLALAAAVLGLGSSVALATYAGPGDSSTPVTLVQGNAANVTIDGKAFQPGATLGTGQQLTVSGGDAVLKIGTTQITVKDGTTLDFHPGSVSPSDSTHTDSSFGVKSGSIVFDGKTLLAGTVLSTVGSEAETALGMAGGKGGRQDFISGMDHQHNWAQTVVLAPPSPEKDLTVLSPSAP